MKIKRYAACMVIGFIAFASFVYANTSFDQMEITGEKSDAGYYNGDITVAYKVADEDGISKVALTVNEAEVDAKEIDPAATEGEGEFEITKEFLEENKSDDLKYLLILTVTDAAGNEKTNEEEILADISTPKISITGIEDEKIYNETKDIEIKVSDDDENVSFTEILITKDGDEVYKEADVAEGAYTASAEGMYEVTATAVDSGGNEVTEKLSFTIDKTAPEITMYGIEDGEAYNEDREIKITAEDSGDEITLTEVAILKETTEVYKENDIEEGLFTAAEEGTYKITAEAIDDGGNSIKTELTFLIDKTAPALTDVTLTGELREGFSWFYGGVLLNSSASDDFSELSEVRILINGKLYESIDPVDTPEEPSDPDAPEDLTKTPVSTEFTKEWLAQNASDDGNYEVKVEAEDYAGNITEKNASFHADVTAPEIVFTGVEEDAYVNAMPSVLCKSTDKYASLGVINVTVTKDGSEHLKIEQPGAEIKISDFTDDGAYVISAFATDMAGNVSETKTIAFTKDMDAPSLTDISITGSKRDGFEWFYADVTITADASDPVSGLARAKITVNGTLIEDADCDENTKTVSANLPTTWFEQNESADGKYDVTVEVTDKTGNVTTKEGSFYADVTTPEISLTGIEEGTHTDTSPTIVCTSSDNYAGEGTINLVITKDDAAFRDVSQQGAEASFSDFSEDGVYVIKATATDKAGNVSEEKMLSFVKDTTAPEISDIDISGERRNGFEWFYANVKLKTDAKDQLSDIGKVKITVNGAEFMTLTGSAQSQDITADFTRDWFRKNASSSGKYDVVVEVADIVGNTGTKESSFFADVTTPEITLTGIEEGTHTNTSPTIVCKATDNYIKQVTSSMTIKKDKTNYKKIEKQVSEINFRNFSHDGVYEISVIATDKAGNTSEVKKLSFVKDTIAPGIKLSGAVQDEYYPSAKTITVDITEKNYPKTKVTTELTKTLEGAETNLSFGIVPDRENFSTRKTFSETGTYALTVSAVDKAGNESKSKELTFTVDVEAPEIEIKADNGGYNSLIAPQVIYRDSYFEECDITLTRVREGDVSSIRFSDSESETGGERIYDNFPILAEYDDIYELSCTVTDKSGNSFSESQTFSVNRFGSQFELSEVAKEHRGVYLNSLDDELSIIEYNVTGLTESNAVLIKDGIDMKERISRRESSKNGWSVYEYIYPRSLFSEEGIYEMNVTSTDKTGNFSEFKKDEGKMVLTVDKTAPIISISGIQEGARYDSGEAEAMISVNDGIKLESYTIRCADKTLYDSRDEKKLLENQTVVLPNGYKQQLEVTAYDAAGNKSEERIGNITVSGNFFVRLFANKLLVMGICVIVAITAVAAYIALKRRRKAEHR